MLFLEEGDDHPHPPPCFIGSKSFIQPKQLFMDAQFLLV